MERSTCFRIVGTFIYFLLLLGQIVDTYWFLTFDYPKVISFYGRPTYFWMVLSDNEKYLFTEYGEWYINNNCQQFFNQDRTCYNFAKENNNLMYKILDIDTKKKMNMTSIDFIPAVEIGLYFICAYLVRIYNIWEYCSDGTQQKWIWLVEALEFSFASFPIFNSFVYAFQYDCCFNHLGLKWINFHLFAKIMIIPVRIIFSCYFINFKYEWNRSKKGCWDVIFCICIYPFFYTFILKKFKNQIVKILLGFLFFVISSFTLSFFLNILLQCSYEYGMNSISYCFYIQVVIIFLEMIFNIIELKIEKCQNQQQRQVNYQNEP